MVQRFYAKPASEAGPGKSFLKLVSQLIPDGLLVIPSLDHFGSAVIRDGVLRTLIQNGVRLKVQNASADDEAVLAKFKADARRARFDRAKERGAYRNCGRPRKIDPAAVRKLAADGLTLGKIAAQLGIGRTSADRILKAA
jgi:hypothetical protein